MNYRRTLVIALGAVALATSFASFAQQPPAYPARPVRLIVPYAAGGPVDSVARLIVPRLV